MRRSQTFRRVTTLHFLFTTLEPNIKPYDLRIFWSFYGWRKGRALRSFWIKKLLYRYPKISCFIEEPSTLTSNFIYWWKCRKNIEVVLFYCKSENQVADISTKSLHVSIFEFLTESCDVAVFDSGGVLFYILRTYLNGLETSSDY